MPKIVPDKIIKEKRRSLSLQITPNGELIVHAPKFLPSFFIDKFIQEKSDWIEKKLTDINSRPKATKKTYVQGEKILYLGKAYTFALTDAITIHLAKDNFFFPKALQFRAQKELESWYIKQAKEIITKRVIHHAKEMKATYKDIFFSNTSSKWGTCFADNTLQFNWRLIMAPLLVIDYVVIHELAHTSEKNHQRSFWSKVRQYTPAYRQHRLWLERNGHLLVI